MKIFTESVFSVDGKDYEQPKQSNVWAVTMAIVVVWFAVVIVNSIYQAII